MTIARLTKLQRLPFYVMWVVGIEVQLTTRMSRLPVRFCGQSLTPLCKQNFQEWKRVISLNFHGEFDCRTKAFDMVKTFL
jgi:hypothetical protein